jgi:N-acetyltransferase
MHTPADFDGQPTLEGPTLLLRPLRADDLEPLYAAAADPLIWQQHPDPLRYQRSVFEEKYFAGALAGGMALVILNKGTGQMIGSSRYYDVDPDQREVAIGYTFLVRSHWGGTTNAELKRLMLDHAFRWAKRVWFHVGPLNLRSRRAMEKIGGRYSHEAARVTMGVSSVSAFYYIDHPG